VRQLDVQRRIVSRHVAAQHQQLRLRSVKQMANILGEARERQPLGDEAVADPGQLRRKLADHPRDERANPTPQRGAGPFPGRPQTGARKAFANRMQQAGDALIRTFRGKLVGGPMHERTIEDRLCAGALAQ
jgi:hypothetical protein